jgi:adenylate kinase family enzyme
MNQIVIYGPSGSGKSTLSVKMMSEGKAVFDSDFIYPMFHIKGGDPNSNPKAEEVWTRVVERFKEVWTSTNGMKGYEAIFTADERIRDYLKQQGLRVRNLTKTFHKEGGLFLGERDSLSKTVDLDQDTEAVSK